MLEADIDYSNPQTDIEKVQFIATLESDLTNFCIRKTPGASWDQQNFYGETPDLEVS